MNDVEVMVSDTVVDLEGQLPISLNYSISDIRNPESRNTSFSKSLKFPGTAVNTALFGRIFDIASANPYNASEPNKGVNFNPNKKAPVVVYKNGVQVIKGSLKIANVNVTGTKIEYIAIIFGELIDLFQELGETKLTALDFSEYDHDYTKENQRESWSVGVQRDGVLDTSVFAGAATTEFPNGLPQGQGYLYPMVDYGMNSNPNQFYVEHLFPVLYCKEVWDKIFTFAGFSYTSAFVEDINSELFKRLVLVTTVENFKFSTAEIINRLFKATRTINQIGVATFSTNPPVNAVFGSTLVPLFNDDVNDPNFDTSGIYNPATGIYTVNNMGYYSIVATAIVDFEFTVGGGAFFSLNAKSAYISIVRVSNNNSEVLEVSYQQFEVPQTQLVGTYTTAQLELSVEVNDVRLQVGDQLFARVGVASFDGNAYFTNVMLTPIYGTVRTTIYPGSTFYNQVDNLSIMEGAAIDINDKLLPPDLKMRDFLLSIIQMFNLHVDIDKLDSKKLIVKTWDEFYGNQPSEDWTDKLDVSNPISIKPMGELNALQYRFSYTKDTDYYNKTYDDRYDEVYGQREITVDNDFVKATKKIIPKFSPTPLVGKPAHGRIVPEVIEVDQNGVRNPSPSKTRVLFYGGLLPSSPTWEHFSALDNNGVPRSTYPYVGHWDNPTLPTLDLNFGLPREVYYSTNQFIPAIQVSNNNLYNQYWRKLIEEITDKDSKVVTAMFKLSALDINSLDFAKLKYVDGHLLRLNRVMDYDFSNDKLVRCEFIKPKFTNGFVAEAAIMTGGAGGGIGDEPLPIERTNQGIDLNFVREGVQVTGYNNLISPLATNVIIQGNNNVVAADACNIIIRGNNNIIRNGVTNVTLLGIDSQEIIMSGTTIVNGGFRPQFPIIEGGLNQNRQLYQETTYLLIEGGEDEVRAETAYSPIHTLDGNG